jgi:hypothetical protein
MVHNISIALAAAYLFGAAPPPARTHSSTKAADLSGPAKPLQRTSDAAPRLMTASLDLALRLFLYWSMIYILRRMAAQDRTPERRTPLD